jgi:hypothetical protein
VAPWRRKPTDLSNAHQLPPEQLPAARREERPMQAVAVAAAAAQAVDPTRREERRTEKVQVEARHSLVADPPLLRTD